MEAASNRIQSYSQLVDQSIERQQGRRSPSYRNELTRLQQSFLEKVVLLLLQVIGLHPQGLSDTEQLNINLNIDTRSALSFEEMTADERATCVRQRELDLQRHLERPVVVIHRDTAKDKLLIQLDYLIKVYLINASSMELWTDMKDKRLRILVLAICIISLEKAIRTEDTRESFNTGVSNEQRTGMNRIQDVEGYLPIENLMSHSFAALGPNFGSFGSAIAHIDGYKHQVKGWIRDYHGGDVTSFKPHIMTRLRGERTLLIISLACTIIRGHLLRENQSVHVQSLIQTRGNRIVAIRPSAENEVEVDISKELLYDHLTQRTEQSNARLLLLDDTSVTRMEDLKSRYERLYTVSDQKQADAMIRHDYSHVSNYVRLLGISMLQRVISDAENSLD